MRKIIDGIEYDTDKALHLGVGGDDNNLEVLYRDITTSNFFLLCEGDDYAGNDCDFGIDIIRLTKTQAKKWLIDNTKKEANNENNTKIK